VRVTRASFGEYTSIGPAQGDSAVFWFDRKHWFIDDGREAKSGEYSYSAAKPTKVPFERRDFGDRDRFSWDAGACALGYKVEPTYWGERYALYVEGSALVVLDATRPTIVRFDIRALGAPSSYRPLLVHGGKLWVVNDKNVCWFALDDLAALFDHAPGPVPLELAQLYPRHRPQRSLVVTVDEVGPELVWARAEGRKLSFPPVAGLEPKMQVTLHDELVADFFLAIELPGKPREPLYGAPAPASYTYSATLSIDAAVDPAGGLARPAEAPAHRQADLDRLFAARADDPEDPSIHAVIVDLLEDTGEPYAPELQALLADGKPRPEALGTLASYLRDIEYRGGLPWVATLSPTAPGDAEIGDLVAADQRLGFLYALRLGDGNYNVYAKLVASPRAAGLRHVDASRHSILAALIAGNRRDLTRLSNVKFATREVNEALADPTFDRVREIETETASAVVAKLLAFVIRDELQVFSRAPRSLILRDRLRNDVVLLREVLEVWDQLPLAGVTVAGAQIRRDGTARVSPTTSPLVLEMVAARFRLGI
jgi:hypothetical protein